MKKLAIILLILAISLPAMAQTDIAGWSEYSLQPWSAFYDIYATARGGFAICGTVGQMWLVVLDDQGAVDFNVTVGSPPGADEVEFSIASTVIETDNGAFLLGGRAGVNFAASLVDHNGRELWFNKYLMGSRQGQCYSAIELKSGEFLLAGYVEEFGNRDGYLVMIESDGDVIWARKYGAGNADEEFRSIREIGEEGVIVSGSKLFDLGVSDRWILFVNYNGDPYLDNVMNSGLHYFPTDMASVSDGYGIAGTVEDDEGDTDFFLTKIDRLGRHTFTQHYSLYQGSLDKCQGVTGLPDDGFVLFGFKDGGSLPYKALRLRTDSGGQQTWAEKDRYRGNYSYYTSAVSDTNGAVTFCGIVPGFDWMVSKGLVSKAYGESNAPIIVWKQPEESEFKTLQGDEIEFKVGVFDPDRGEENTFVWYHNNVWAGRDSVATILFPEQGDDHVRAYVMDTLYSTTADWQVHVTSFYISDWAPDTMFLLVERTDTVDFELETRYLGFDEPEYQWIVNGETVDTTATYRHPCDIPGDYIVEGISHLGDIYEQKTWLVRVNTILGRWEPWSRALTVPLDTTIVFRAEPYNPDSLEVYVLWTRRIPGSVRRLGHGPVMAYTFNELGPLTIVAAVNIGMEIDRIPWEIQVVLPEPDWVDTGEDLLPSEPTLTGVYPNPFNSSAAFTYAIPTAGRMKLILYDMTGRVVKSIVNGFITPGRRTVRLDASTLPAGLYLLQMEAGETRITQKAVVIK